MTPRDERGGLGRSAVSGGGWTALQNAYLAFVSLVVVAVLTRQLGPQEFGVFATAIVATSVLSLLADFGLVEGLVRARSVSPRLEGAAFGVALLIASASFVGLVALASFGADLFPQEVAGVLLALSPALLLVPLRVIPLARLTRDLAFRSLALRQMVVVTVAGAAAVCAAAFGLGPFALVVQAIFHGLTEVVMLYVLCPWSVRLIFGRSELREIVRFGLPYLGIQGLHALRDRGTDLLVVIGFGVHGLGLWVIANRLASAAVQLFASVVNTVSLPLFSAVAGDGVRLSRAYVLACNMTASITVPVLFLLGAVSESLVPLVFGENWDSAGRLAVLVAIAYGVGAITWLEANVWWAIGRPSIELILTAVVSLFALGFVASAGKTGSVTILGVAVLLRAMTTVPLRLLILVLFARVPARAFVHFGGVLLAAGVAATAAYAVTRSWDGTTILEVCAAVALGTGIYVVLSFILVRKGLLEAWKYVSGAIRTDSF